MSPVFDCADDAARAQGQAAAHAAISEGRLVVLPTDTVYGLAADAFSATGVAAIFSAKGRGRDMPPPVLVPSPRTVDGLAMAMPSYVRRLMEHCWPGGLTLIVRAQQSLSWDLGETNGTVGLRMPDDEVALALLEQTGPLAVSSANRTGQPPATTVTEAGFQLGPFVDVYLDGGPRDEREPSTVVDCTKPDPVVLREGAISVARLREVLGDIHLVAPIEDQGEAPAEDEMGDGDVGDGDDGLSGGAPMLPPDVVVKSSADVEQGPEPTLGQHWDDASAELPEADGTPDSDQDDPAPAGQPPAPSSPAPDQPEPTTGEPR